MFKRFVDLVQILVAVAVVATVVLLMTVSPTVAEVETPDAALGGELYQSNCAGCHGSAGEGGIGPSLAAGLTRFEAVGEFVAFVSTGVPGRMPGFETRLSPDQVNAVVQYVWADLAGR
ncbi:MAG TPA: cytochrome c [Acidimicrobiia bacterium]|nr:cytochrome c [Acidimicrobiia bacterium]